MRNINLKQKNMKIIYTLLLAFITIGTNSQTVTTFLDSGDAFVDDAMALDSKGNLYGSSFYGGTVYKITPDGISTPFITGLAWANGLAVDSEDNIYVAEYLNASINKYDNDGNLIEKLSIGTGYPSGLIKAYKSDKMIFTDVGDNSINELSADGSIRVLYQGGPLNIPVGLAYGPGGDLYIGNYIGREIYRLPNGENEVEYVATVPVSSNVWPYLAFITYAQGSIYGTVYGEHKIYKIDPRHVDDVEIFSGSIYGDTDGNVADATYAYPAGIIANKSGNTLYVSEFSGFGNIRKITNGNGNRLQKKATNLNIVSYPNPASDYINIETTSETNKNNDYTIKLYSINSNNLVLEKKKVKIKGTYSLSLDGLNTGLYILEVSAKGISESKTIIINQE